MKGLQLKIMAKEILLTDEGLKQYESELEYLKTIKRKEITEKIKVALSFGDLSENSEYDEAKNEQAKTEARIAELEAMLKVAKVIDEGELSTDRVNMGSKVEVQDIDRNATLTFQIVGSAEANPRQGKLSDESPIGKALIGHKCSETVVAETPSGGREFKILKIML